MFEISYSDNLKGEITISGSKNAALKIIPANFLIDNQVQLLNKPDISDLHILEELFEEACVASEGKDYFDLTMEKVQKIRVSIMLIPYGLKKFGKVKFLGSGGCNIGKRPLDTFDDAFQKAGVDITYTETGKEYTVVSKPKKNIMLQEFSVTTTEALMTYLAFMDDVDHEITIYQCATEPHVKNLVDFLNNAGADIQWGIDHTLKVKPAKVNIKEPTFRIVPDYIETGTYFAIGAGADNSEITIKNCNVDDLSSIYNIAEKIGIDFTIIDKHTLRVSSKNKKSYKATKFETRIFPGFPTDLQSIFGTLLTQAQGISKIFETLFEGRFGYLAELENLGAKVEILNPHQVMVIGPTKLKGNYVTSTDLRGGGAMVLAGIMAQGTTNIMNEAMILRGYSNIIEKLQNIGVNIKRIEN